MPDQTRSLRIILLAFLGFVAFTPTLRGPFQFDDHAYIENNPFLRTWDVHALKHDWLPGLKGPQEFYYRPLQSMINRLQYSAFALKPFAYHLTNLSFHIGNAILLTELLLLLGLPALSALAVGTLFVVHPIVVSELLMVSGLPEIMCFFFSLAALSLMIKPNRSFIGAGLCYGLALLSKESALAVPIFYAIVSRFDKNKEEQRSAWFLWGCLTLLYICVRTFALGAAGLAWDPASFPAFFLRRLPVILWRYSLLVLYPWNLHAYRLIPAINPLWAYGFAALTLGMYFYWGKPRVACACLLWGLAAFVPKISVMLTGQYMLDHWAYPALPAILVPLGIIIARGWDSKRDFAKGIATVVFAGLLCFYIFSAQFHALVRATDEKNYRWSLQFTRATPLLFNLGLICLRTGRAAEAITDIEPIYQLYPNDPNIRQALAAAYTAAGKLADAQRLLK